jgi:hypothetical protein
MKSDAELIELVHKIIDAENEHNSTIAESILAQNFAAITRSGGAEQSRNLLLEEIANPKNPNLRRELDEHDFWVNTSEELGVVRSLVTTTDRGNPEAIPRRFRNIHVFEKQQAIWRCIAWQVTELKTEVQQIIDFDFLKEDYKMKLDYLTAQLERMWGRFNFFLTIELALFGFLGFLTFDVKNLNGTHLPILLGLLVSTLWYLVSAQERALVDKYRSRANRTAKRVAATHAQLAWFEQDHAAAEVESFWRSPISWYWRRTSITRLPVLLAIGLFILWLVLLLYWRPWVEPMISSLTAISSGRV